MSKSEALIKEGARIPSADEKEALYDEASKTLNALLDGESDPVMIMSSIASVLHHTMPHYFWTGFYRVVGDELCVGPYQGTLACLKIQKGRGVCGEAWVSGETMIVDDVHEHPGHIACDARSASEIVVPLKDSNGLVIAVFDIDSTMPAAFDKVDQSALESMMDGLLSITA